jgi:putative Ca2+/H+ antiporter (TMEM165/GDT1 family)
MYAFALSFGLILVAELGDKSQLMALAFASRYRAWTVLVAISLAALLILGVSVLIGSAFALALPTATIRLAAGLAFFGFAVWTLRGDDPGEGEESRARATGHWAILTIAAAFVLAELGDKTMLTTVTLATTQEPVGTWLGATAGMVVADAIAIAIGAMLGTRLPQAAVRLLSAAAFAAVGAFLIAESIGVV